jgi:type IV secretion/conjugal transfer VirB4 family ATPase
MDTLSLLLAGAAGAGLASLVSRGREDRRAPQGLADLLNWAFLVDDGVVLLKDGALMAAFRYRGPDLASATGAELGTLASQVNEALLPFGDGWMLHVDAVRSPAPGYRAGDFPDDVTRWIDDERRHAFRSSRPQFVSEYTLAVTFVPPREVYARAAALFVQRGDRRPAGAGQGGASGAASSVDWAGVLAGYLGALDALARRLQTRLRMERLDSDALVTHLHRCLTGLAHPVAAPSHGSYLNTVLASQELVGGFAPRVGERHVRVVAIVGYPDASTPGRLDFLNSLPVAYRWSSRWVALSPHTAERLIKRQQQHWFMGRKGMGAFLRDVTGAGDPLSAARREQQNEALFHDGDATRMAHDAAAAAAANASGAVRFGYATQVLVLSDEDPARADAAAALAVAALQDRGFPARVETVNALDALLGSLPGHGAQNLRRPILSSRNAADLWPVTSVWPGLEENPSPYFPKRTPALMHVATDGSTPFRLNLHAGDVGHTLLVGATGAGKSTFVGLTVAQWQRYAALGARTFVFDVGYSHWLLARARGARHHDIGVADPSGAGAATSHFQPLADVHRPEERAWAAGWLESLLELQGVTITPPQRARLDHALVLLGAEPRQFRTLTELTVQLQDPALVAALRPYTIAGPYGRLLDAGDDALATAGAGRARHQVYELRHLMDVDDKVLVPVLLYLFRHVERQLDGAPALIVIEELWAPLMRTVFANRIKQWLLTLRKQNAAVMLVAHTPAQLEAVPGKQVLVESCPTRILLPNADATNPATARLYAELGLNEREIAIIAGAQPKRDYYVRSPAGSRLVRLELGPIALAFLGSPAGLTLDEVRPQVETLAARYGAEWPAEWLRSLGIDPPKASPPADTPSFASTATLGGANRNPADRVMSLDHLRVSTEQEVAHVELPA